jgi:hypothetical protein
MDKLSIQNEMAQFDRKNREFYDSLTPEEKKKFSNYLMIRYGSSVRGSRDLQEFYLISTNERLNKHFFSINRHPKLQWLCATSVSPGMGNQFHQWIAPKKKEAGSGANQKLLAQLFPNYKSDDIEVLDAVNTQKEITAYLRELGQEAKK